MEMKRSAEFGRGPHGLREVFAPRIRGRWSNLNDTVEPFFEINHLDTEETWNFSLRATDGKSSLHEALRMMIKGVVHVNQQTCSHTTVCATWMLSRTSGDKNTQRSDAQSPPQDVPICVQHVGDPATSRLRAIASKMKNEKTTCGICSMRTTKARELSTVVAAMSPRHWIQEGMAIVLDVLRQCGQPETQTHTHLVTHFYETRIVTVSDHR